MSEETTQPSLTPDQPAAQTAVVDKPVAAAVKPEPPAVKEPPPFSIDAIMQSTTRFTRKTWNLVLEMRSDMNLMKTAPMRFSLEATSTQSAEGLEHELKEAGVKEISRNGNTLSFSTTFETLQSVIKRPETVMVDGIRL